MSILSSTNSGRRKVLEKAIAEYGLNSQLVMCNNDGTIDYFGTVDLRRKKLRQIPFSFNHVYGDFRISGNHLRSLRGAPIRVDNAFECDSNCLRSLKHAPKYVGGRFDCSMNQIKTLFNAPEFVGGAFDCSWNQLSSLKGAPETIGTLGIMAFNCSYNCLTSLDYLPKNLKRENIAAGHNEYYELLDTK